MGEFCSIVGVLFCVRSRLRDQCSAGDTITPQFVRHYRSGDARFLETLEESLRGCCVSSLLQIHINDFAVLVDGPPQVVLFPADLHEHFIQKVSIAKSTMSTSQTSGKFRTEFIDPKSYRFVTDGDISLGWQILDISSTEIEAVVEPDCLLDDRRWEPMALVDAFHSTMLPEGHLTWQYLIENMDDLRSMS